MNIEKIISEFKCKKLGNPTSAVKIAEIPNDIFENFKRSIIRNYNLEDELYSTKEYVFFDTRRIVAKTPYVKTEKQKYTNIDFDYNLLDICGPVIQEIKKYLPNSDPTLLQLATLLPGQKLQWHIDTYLYQQFSNKIHVPLFTNEQSTYEIFLENKHYEKIYMEPGSIWNINNLELHRSVNQGYTFRTHLIIDFIDKDILSILETLDVNYFHHRLNYVSDYADKVFEILKSSIE